MRRNEFYNEIEKRFPWMPTTFSKLEKKLQTFDMRQPMTTLTEFEREINRMAARLQHKPQLLIKGVRYLAKHPRFKRAMTDTMQQLIRKLDNQVAADPRAAELIRFISDVDAEVPYRSWLVLQEHVDVRILFRPLCMAGTSIEEAQGLRGEAKAGVLIEALGKTCEVLYKPYLLALWQLTCISKGKKPTQPGFGSLVNELSKRLPSYPRLVDPNARWMRNSARHERWEPIPNEEAIVMWDDHTPRVRVTLSELEAKVTELFQISGLIFPTVATRYLFHNVLNESGMWDVFRTKLPGMIELIKPDGSTNADIDQLMEEHMEPVRNKFAPLVTFVESNFPNAVGNDVAAHAR
jgi:hypothetical protein